MHSIVKAKMAKPSRRSCFCSVTRPFGIMILLVNTALAFPAIGATSAPVKIAVFEFELEDVSAAGATSKVESAADLSRMRTVTSEARRVLKESGRYSLIDTAEASAEAVKERTLRNCGGCDSGIALKLGAELSLIGVVTRVAQTEYYASLQITDTKTGKVVNQQNAFFTGADDAWASGVRLLLKHGVLADAN
jgi:Protein of unknown function (DUF2380)